MGPYIARRLLLIPVILFGLSVLIFAMLQLLSPAERAALYVTSQPRTPRALQDIIDKYGLDDPVYVQYADWLGRLFHGDLGWSKSAQRPVLEAIKAYFPASVELALWSFAPIVVVGIWLGVQAALHHDRLIDQAARVFSIVGYSFPTFVFGLLMLLIFYAALGWFPPGRLSPWATAVVYSPAFTSYTGMHTLDALPNGRFDIFVDALRHLVLPALTLAYGGLATIVRFTRAGVLDTLQQDFVFYERAMGYRRRRLVWLLILRNSVTATVTQIGLLFGGLIAGGVVVEAIFDWPGIGSYAVNSILTSDYKAILAVTLVVGVIYAIVNIAVDIAHALLDPRVAESL